MAAPVIGGFLAKLMGNLGSMGGVLGAGAQQAGANQGVAHGMMMGQGGTNGGGLGAISPQGAGGMISQFSSPSSGKAPDMMGAGQQAFGQAVGPQQLMSAVNQLQRQGQWQPPQMMRNTMQGAPAERLRRLMMGG